MRYKGTWEEKISPVQKAMTVVGAVLCVIFGFTLICNLTIIVKGSLNPDTPPSVLGTTPLVVLSGSMSGDAPDHIETGDMILVEKVDAEDLTVGDVIAFKQGKVIVTHRILDITSGEDGQLLFTTQGDANDAPDQQPVPAADIVGIFTFRIPRAGNFALFLQTPLGIFLFIGVPLLAFIVYDILRRQRILTREGKKTAELEAEVRRLRALAAEKDSSNL